MEPRSPVENGLRITFENGTRHAGDARPADFDRLFADYVPAAQRVALAVLRSPADAEDVALKACRAVLQKLKAGVSIDDPSGYLARTAWRLARARSQATAGKRGRGQGARQSPRRGSSRARGTETAQRAHRAVRVGLEPSLRPS
jgi:DNA-directed RNA polymerase specialized sigma24 family protein